jgi:glycine/D-amino acid oxidase-like deaminating enzyme
VCSREAKFIKALAIRGELATAVIGSPANRVGKDSRRMGRNRDQRCGNEGSDSVHGLTKAIRLWLKHGMMRLVHPDALHFDQTVPSYWEDSADALNLTLGSLQGDHTCDVAVIGGGFTGLGAALTLAEAGVDVHVLEAGAIGWGASGRNGGFACIGSHKLPYIKMIERYGRQETQHYYATMRRAVEAVAENCEQHGIDAWRQGKGEITLAHLPQRFEDLKSEQEFHRDIFGEENELIPPEEMRQRGFGGPTFHGGLLGPTGFGIHPLNYVRGLARATHKAGATLHSHARVTRWEERDGVHHLFTAQGSLRAKRVVVATNGYTPEKISRYHAGRLLPALSNILVTRPLTDDELSEQGWTSSTLAYDSRQLLHYFRLLPNKRFMFGARGSTDSSNDGSAAFRRRLITSFNTVFPAWRNVDVTHYWRGMVCLSFDRVPYVGAVDDRKSVWTAIAYHGNGVSMANWCGRAVARMMLGEDTRDVPTIITRRLAKFPLPWLRPAYLGAAYLWFEMQDRR